MTLPRPHSNQLVDKESLLRWQIWEVQKERNPCVQHCPSHISISLVHSSLLFMEMVFTYTTRSTHPLFFATSFICKFSRGVNSGVKREEQDCATGFNSFVNIRPPSSSTALQVKKPATHLLLLPTASYSLSLLNCPQLALPHNLQVCQST